MKLSVVIPVYNEENTVLKITEKVERSLNSLPERITGWEIVFVDDGSKDNTRNILKENFSDKENFKLLLKEVNEGKGAAIRDGFAQTSGDIVLIQDADMEYDPGDYPTLLHPFFEGVADVVYGSRFKGIYERVLYFWHYCGNKFLTLLSNMFTNLKLTDMETCYKVFSGPLIRNMVLESNRFGIEPEMTAKISKVKGIRIYEVPISYYGRTYEEGKKIGWKDGFSALWCIFKFNVLRSYQESFRVPKEKLLEV